MAQKAKSEAEIIDVTANASFLVKHSRKAVVFALVLSLFGGGVVWWFGARWLDRDASERQHLAGRIESLSDEVRLLAEGLAGERHARAREASENEALKNELEAMDATIETLSEAVARADEGGDEASGEGNDEASNEGNDEANLAPQAPADIVQAPLPVAPAPMPSLAPTLAPAPAESMPPPAPSLAPAPSESAPPPNSDISPPPMRLSGEAIRALSAVRLGFLTGELPPKALETLNETAPLPEVMRTFGEGFWGRAQLRTAFPRLARMAVKQSAYEDNPESAWAHIKAFLKSQISVRSLQPRQGESTDAILSRTEAALALNRFDIALKEMEALSKGGAEVFAHWQKKLRHHQSLWQAFSAYETTLLMREDG